MNVQKVSGVDNYVVIRNIFEHGILTDDGGALSAMPETQTGRLNVWSYAEPARAGACGDGE